MATFLRTRATLGVNAGSNTSLLTFYWDSTGAGITAMATETVARVRAFVNAAGAIIGAGTIFTPNLLVDEIDENTGAIVNQVVAAAPLAVTFSGTGNFLPLQTQAVCQFQTATFIAGRRVRGRCYVPGITAGNASAGGNILPAAITVLGNANTALGTTVVTALSQRVWHRPNPITHTGGLSIPVATRSVNPSFGVLRSRRK